MKVTDRTRINIHPERAVPEEAAEILSAGMVAHVGFVEDGITTRQSLICCTSTGVSRAGSWLIWLMVRRSA